VGFAIVTKSVDIGFVIKVLTFSFFCSETLQIKQYRVIFLRFCHENPKAQKYLLGGVEQIIALNKATLLPKIVHILKALYDADILEEEVILDWGRRASKKYVSKDLSEEMHAKAKPFLDWLENAEESSDEEDSDDESDVEVCNSVHDYSLEEGHEDHSFFFLLCPSCNNFKTHYSFQLFCSFFGWS
jgi:hypothetical protein